MAKTTRAPDPDLLAAVVLETLVAAAGAGMTLAQVARACERRPDRRSQAREVEIALGLLVEDDLAARDGERYRATRAAIRADELRY